MALNDLVAEHRTFADLSAMSSTKINKKTTCCTEIRFEVFVLNASFGFSVKVEPQRIGKDKSVIFNLRMSELYNDLNLVTGQKGNLTDTFCNQLVNGLTLKCRL
jgi:hypothetical protein